MKISDIFLEAAKVIEEDKSPKNYGYSCCTIFELGGDFNPRGDAALYFRELFLPTPSEMYMDSDDSWWNSPVFTKKNQAMRCTALLLAHHMAKDEGL